LNNIPTTPPALEAYVSKKSMQLFDSLRILNHREQEARYEIGLETYTKKIQIEGRIMEDMVNNQVIPSAIRYQGKLVNNVNGMKNVLGNDFKKSAELQLDMIREISEHITVIKNTSDEMVEERKKANNLDSPRKQAQAYCDKVKPLFETIRYHVDKLEAMIDDEEWPLPKYREMLFLK
jgi:glutamine synthetase